MSEMALELAPRDDISVLSDDDKATLLELLNQLEQKAVRNKLRREYYDSQYFLRDFGIAIPPQMRSIEAVLGWPAKAVDAPVRRLRLEGFTLPDASADDLGVGELWADNNLDVEAPQAHTSAALHAVAFLTVTRGDVAAGEPEVLIAGRSAEDATGLWDARRRGLRAGLSVIERDAETGQPVEMVMYLPGRNISFTRTGAGWEIRNVATGLPGRVLMEPLVYQPRYGRPFGSSRLSRPVMALTDAALRTLVRSEVTAEFFSAPQRYALGADESAFMDADGNPRGQWESIIGRVWAIGRDEDGDIPEVGQFPQTSMQPHVEQLRMLATLFAGETSIPVSSLGVVQDNPSSAEAIYAAKEELIIEAEWAANGFGAGWRRAMLTALQLRDRLTELPREWLALRPRWRDPATPSMAAAADAVTKQVSAGILPAESEVTYEQLGYDQADIDRLMADRRRAGAQQRLTALAAAAQAARRDPMVAELGERRGDGG